MEDWRRHFSKLNQPTQYDLFRFRAREVGYSQAYLDVYGPLPDLTPMQWAEQLRDQGKSIREISFWIQLLFGYGSKSVIHRWLNPKSMQKHLANKRKKPNSPQSR